MIRVLSIDYVPKRTPLREEYIEEISKLDSAILTGPVGVGKTLTLVKAFGERMVRTTCYTYRSIPHVIRTLCWRAGVHIPSRGYDTSLALALLVRRLRDRELVLVLDDFDYLLRRYEADKDKTNAPIELLDRLIEIRLFIVVHGGRGLRVLRKRIGEILEYKPYTKAQIEEILYSRVEEAEDLLVKSGDPMLEWFLRNVDDDLIELVAWITGYDTGGSGDCRLALELLNRACVYARMGNERLSREHVKMSYMDVIDMNVLRSLYEPPLALRNTSVKRVKRLSRDIWIKLLEGELDELDPRVLRILKDARLIRDGEVLIPKGRLMEWIKG